MTSPSPASENEADRALLEEAARACGPLLRGAFQTEVTVWSKDDSSPVTDIDLALDEQLHKALRGARPHYGWVSEESEEHDPGVENQRTFIVDPLDGTRAFIRGLPEFCVALAVEEGRHTVAGAIYNPITDELFSAHRGGGALLNGAPMQVTQAPALENALMAGRDGFFTAQRWASNPWPSVRTEYKNALSYRLALVASGRFDGMIALGFKHDWDIAAGALIVSEAGGVVSDPWGAPLRFNTPEKRSPGLVAAGPALHPLLIERVRITAHPGAPRG
jgi:myo-inositol-1(or 4)-monophosphatase